MKSLFKTLPGMKFLPDSKHEFNICDCSMDNKVNDGSSCLMGNDHSEIYNSWCFKNDNKLKEVYKFHYFLLLLNYEDAEDIARIRQTLTHDFNLLFDDELGEAKLYMYGKDALVFAVFNDDYTNVKKRLKKFAKK